MSEFKGTKGRWEVKPTQAKREDGTPLYHDISVDGSHFISTFRNRDLDIDSVQDLANAKLIASAPEMLEMLERLQVSFDWISKNCLLPKIKNQEDADLQIKHIPYNMQEIKQLISKITE